MAARRSPPPPARRPDPTPAARPAPRPVERHEQAPSPPPPPRPAPRPAPAPARQPSPAARKAGGSAAGTPRREAGKPTPGKHPKRPVEGQANKEADRRQPGPDELARARQGTGDTGGNGGGDAQVASADTGGNLAGTDTQQEIEVLRQEVGDLQFGRTWQAADPPKLAGKFGIALQGVEVGNNLRVAGRNFAHKAQTAAKDAGATVTMVRNHKPPVYRERK